MRAARDWKTEEGLEELASHFLISRVWVKTKARRWKLAAVGSLPRDMLGGWIPAKGMSARVSSSLFSFTAYNSAPNLSLNNVDSIYASIICHYCFNTRVEFPSRITFPLSTSHPNNTQTANFKILTFIMKRIVLPIYLMSSG